jgi:Ca-activated chloride channel family protein
MSFITPGLLWGLLLLPLAVAAYLLAQRRRHKYAVRFTNVDLLANLVPKTPAWRRHVPAALYLAALGALVVSLARPQTLVPVPKERATVVMVMDVSGSMAATDVQPNRLTAAKAAGTSFLDRLPAQFRVSLVSFSTVAQALTPPTTDRRAVKGALNALRAEGGTAMGDAIVRALDVAQTVDPTLAAGEGRAGTPGVPGATATPPGRPSFPLPGSSARPGATPAVPSPTPAGGADAAEADEPAPVAILLLSDGASTSGRTQPLDAAAQAQRLGIPIYTIALGTPTGTVEIRDRGFRQLVPVPPDEVTLRRIASITGGAFFSAPTEADLKAVYQDIGSRIGFDYELQEITFGFAAAGAALLAAGGALGLLWFNRFP